MVALESVTCRKACQVMARSECFGRPVRRGLQCDTVYDIYTKSWHKARSIGPIGVFPSKIEDTEVQVETVRDTTVHCLSLQNI